LEAVFVRLTLILIALGWKLRWKARFNAAFRKQLRDVDRLIVVRTRDGIQARSYHFRDGGVMVTAGAHPGATVSLIWNEVPVAVSTMLSSNELDLFSAIGRGDLEIAGNMQDALWFSDIAG
jgi:hypothetical protein